MNVLPNGWNYSRILRLVFGIVILVQGIVIMDTISMILGLILGGMSVANIGCCGANGCAVNTPGVNKTKSIHNEEPDPKQ